MVKSWDFKLFLELIWNLYKFLIILQIYFNYNRCSLYSLLVRLFFDSHKPFSVWFECWYLIDWSDLGSVGSPLLWPWSVAAGSWWSVSFQRRHAVYLLNHVHSVGVCYYFRWSQDFWILQFVKLSWVVYRFNAFLSCILLPGQNSISGSANGLVVHLFGISRRFGSTSRRSDNQSTGCLFWGQPSRSVIYQGRRLARSRNHFWRCPSLFLFISGGLRGPRTFSAASVHLWFLQAILSVSHVLGLAHLATLLRWVHIWSRFFHWIWLANLLICMWNSKDPRIEIWVLMLIVKHHISAPLFRLGRMNTVNIAAWGIRFHILRRHMAVWNPLRHR